MLVGPPYPYRLSDARAFVDHVTGPSVGQDDSPRMRLYLAMTLAPGALAPDGPEIPTNRYLGMVSLQGALDGEPPTLGYYLSREAWGHGLVSEAVTALLDYAYEQSSQALDQIRAWCFTDNQASRRILEKVGFRSADLIRKWSPLRGQWLASYEMVLTRQAWSVR